MQVEERALFQVDAFLSGLDDLPVSDSLFDICSLIATSTNDRKRESLRARLDHLITMMTSHVSESMLRLLALLFPV
jgi:hypothetical protein